MPSPVLVRLAVLVTGAVTSSAALGLVAPAASADTASPPGLCSLPSSSSASLHAVPLTDPFGRKLR